MNFITHSSTNVGHVRKANEDSYGNLIVPDRPELWVVCDGMGGHVGGAIASKLAVESIHLYWSREDVSDIPNAMSEAVHFANSQIMARVLEQPELNGMGTTLVMIAHFNDKCWVAHVGDSRAYLFSQKQLYRLTKDHSYVQQLVDQRVIEDSEAENHPKKNQILRALGIGNSIEVQISSVLLPMKGDVIILCTDGLNGMINDMQITQICLQEVGENGLENLNARLISGALESGGKDNVTVTSIMVESSPHKQSVFENFNPGLQFDQTMILKEGARGRKQIGEKRRGMLKPLVIILSIIAIIILCILSYFIVTRSSGAKNTSRNSKKLKEVLSESINNNNSETSIKYNFIRDEDSLKVSQYFTDSELSLVFIDDLSFRLSDSISGETNWIILKKMCPKDSLEFLLKKIENFQIEDTTLLKAKLADMQLSDYIPKGKEKMGDAESWKSLSGILNDAKDKEKNNPIEELEIKL